MTDRRQQQTTVIKHLRRAQRKLNQCFGRHRIKLLPPVDMIVARIGLVSVFPEAWRERNLGAGFDHYIAMKKEADIALTQSGLDWIVLRPAVLLDDPGRGTVALGPAELHGEITRQDVADTLAALLHEPRISRQILELNHGDAWIEEAVETNIRAA